MKQLAIHTPKGIAEPGCYIDSRSGQYGLSEVTELAERFLGDPTFYEQFPKDADGNLAGAYGEHGPWDIGNDHTELCVEIADKAEAALNDQTLNGMWEWIDGEFFLTAAVEATCPTTVRGDDDIVGCGTTFTAYPDWEGIVDCPNCGLFFSEDGEA